MMRSKFVRPILLLLVLPIAVVCVWFVSRIMGGTDVSELYPPAAFAPVPQDFPRIIALLEAPSKSNEVEWKAYVEQFEAINEYLMNSGAAQRSTDEEREVIHADIKREFAKSRERATHILSKNLDSIPALIALARAEAFGDGNLPQGLFLIRQARRICESRGIANSADADAREWYLRIMHQEYDMLGRLDRRLEQLEVVNRMESIYEPLPVLKVWPLIKLKKYDEAAEATRLADETGRFAATVLNARCAMAWEMQQRNEAYDAGSAMIEAHGDSPVHWKNHGEAALGVFRFDEAEKAFLKSTTLSQTGLSSTAYNDLTVLYLQQGRIAEAIDAIKNANRQRASREPSNLQQDQATTDLSKAMLMIVLGRGDDAIRHARSAYELPDRGGNTSEDASVLRLSCALGYAAALRLQREQQYEAANSSLLPTLNFDVLLFDHKSRNLTDVQLLCSTLRPHLGGGPGISKGIPSWLRVSVIQFFPPVIAAEAVRQVREVEDHPLAIPYLDAIEAEVCLRLGDYETASSLAKQSLEQLPAQGEKLLCGRVALVGAQAAFLSGDVSSAWPLFQRALQDFPTAFRLLGVALPVRIEHDEQKGSALLARAVGRSRRFRPDASGFVFTFNQGDGMVDCNLTSPNGSQIFAESIKLVDGEPDAIGQALERIHDRLLAPAIDLTQSDMSSLDGSPIAARSREMIDHLLKPKSP